MSSKGGGKTTSNTVSEPWSASQDLLKGLIGDTQSLYGQGGMDIAPWPGIRVAPQSAMTQGSLQGFYDTATEGNPITGQAQQAFGDFMGGNQFGGLDQVKQNALGSIMPGAMSRFSGAGMLDSTLAADAAGRAATEAIAPIEYGAWNDAQNRKLSAMGMAPQLAANSYLDDQMLGMAGGQMDQYNQSLLNAAMGSYGDETNRQMDELQRAASLGMGFGGMGGTSTGTAKEGGGGGTMETIGSIAQTVLPLMAMAFISDRRTKTDIVRDGFTAEGYPQYKFRYHWDGPGMVRVGVMADEVPKDITVPGPYGLTMVNYARVTCHS